MESESQAAVAELARAEQIVLMGEPPERLANLVRQTWVEAERGWSIRLVRDLELKVAYFVIEAPSEPEADKLTSLLARSFDFFTLVELQQSARRAMTADPLLLSRLAVGAGQRADPTTCGIILEALSSRSMKVRAQAAQAASILRWSELLPGLDERLSLEDSPKVQTLLAVAREACARQRPELQGGKAHPGE